MIDLDGDLIGNAPAGAEKAVVALIEAAVEALPVDGEQAWQDEVQFFFGAEDFGPGRAMHRVGRTVDRAVECRGELAGSIRHGPARQRAAGQARQFAPKAFHIAA